MVPTVLEKFMITDDVGELRVRDLAELLREYKRLGRFVAGLGCGAGG